MGMHSLIPQNLYPQVFGDGAILDDIFPSYKLESSTQTFTFTYDRTIHFVLSLTEVSFWDAEKLQIFVDENYRFLVYYITSLNHLNRNDLDATSDELDTFYQNGVVDKARGLGIINKLLEEAQKNRQNFNVNIRLNSSILGIPIKIWSENCSSSLYLGNRDWSDSLCESFVETTMRLKMNPPRLNDITDSQFLYCYFIARYRAQSCRSMSSSLLSCINELYAEQIKGYTSNHAQMLKSLQSKIDRLTKAFGKKEKEAKAMGNQNTALSNAILKLQKQIQQIEKQIRDARKNIETTESVFRLYSEKIENAQQVFDTIHRDHQEVLREINHVTKEIIEINSEIKKLEERETHQAEYDAVCELLRQAQLQESQLQSIYEICAQNSAADRLRRDNDLLKQESQSMDDEIARLEM
jgi:hypothetical protein